MREFAKIFIIVTLMLALNTVELFAADLAPAVVGIKTIHYFDIKRQRPIIADVYYPVDAQQVGEPVPGIMMQAKQARDAKIANPKASSYPLIILSHGYRGSRQHLTWFAEALASKGYIVAAIEHFGNTAYFDTPQLALRRWLRPQDVTEFLNQFLQDNDWKKIINHNKIGFAGFSLGGLTGIWVSGGIADTYETPVVGKSSLYQLAIGATQADVDKIDYTQAKKSYKDDRIKSAFLMAPAHGFSFGPNGLKSVTVPVFIVVGEKDAIAPLQENSEHYAKNIKNSTLKILKGNVTHTAFRNSISHDKLNCANAHEFEISKEVDTQAVHGETARLAIDFFDKTLGIEKGEGR